MFHNQLNNVFARREYKNWHIPIRESKIPYRHLNHKNRQINHATYQDHLDQKQQTLVPDNSDITSIQSYANKSLQNSGDQNIPQKINLGWSDPFSVRQFCMSLRRSYQLVSTKMIVPRKKSFEAEKEIKPFSSTSFEDKAF